MKRFFCLTIAVVGLLPAAPLSLPAQTAASAAAIADQQDAEERYKRLTAQLDDLVAANALQQRRIAELAEQVRNLSDSLNKAQSGTSQFATRDDLRKLTETIQEIDRKREEDKKLILTKFADLAKLPAPPMAPTPRHTEPKEKDKDKDKDKDSSDNITPIPTKGFYYTFEKGKYLSSVISAYNEEFKKNGITKRVTLDMVIKANPGLDPNRIPVGKKIFIPDPSQM